MRARDPARIPVIVGVGETIDRPDDLMLAREPARLMADALRAASDDAGGHEWLGAIESLDIVNSISWPYRDIAGRVAAEIGYWPGRLVHGPVGGETPVRFIHEAALRIASGECSIAAICGGEAEHSVQAARKAGTALPWTEPDPAWSNPRVRHYLHPLARAHGLDQPVFVYPLYETACQAAWGQSPAEGLAESASLWADFAAVAAAQPHAWLRRPVSAAEIATPSAANRPIAWPYTKLTVANPVVNQGAAIILTSLAAAKAAGIAEDRLVHLWSGGAANAPRDWLSRDCFDHSPAQDAALTGALRRAGLEPSELDAIELYSCFPCVPKMARRTLGLPADRRLTVAGGLTFFGAPLNSYMMHAAVAMVRDLRGPTERHGLLYGQGEFVTKHHALIMSNREAERGLASSDLPDQSIADETQGPIPPIIHPVNGDASIEAHTVLFDREGRPTRGEVVVRTDDGSRTIASVPPEELGVLTNENRTAVGLRGRVRLQHDGACQLRLA